MTGDNDSGSPSKAIASQTSMVRFCSGFTLIELVITMLFISVLSAAVALKLTARTGHSVNTQADQLRRDLSRIQLMAISRSTRLHLEVGSGSYTVTSCTTPPSCSTTTAVTDPLTGQSFTVTADTLQAGTSLDFDSLGRPQSGGSLISASTNPARTYTLSDSGSGTSVDVCVRPITGLAYVC